MPNAIDDEARYADVAGVLRLRAEEVKVIVSARDTRVWTLRNRYQSTME